LLEEAVEAVMLAAEAVQAGIDILILYQFQQIVIQ
jgi:hypothetical protein